MSLQRRMQIIDYARHHNTWIVEDDYDSEFRYQGRALPAMQSLDSHGQILYVGSFSKTLFPALRLGYLIAPPAIFSNMVSTTLLTRSVWCRQGCPRPLVAGRSYIEKALTLSS